MIWLNEEILWDDFLNIIIKKTNPVSFNTWFNNITLLNIKDNKITIKVPYAMHKKVLSDKPLFVLINSYTTGLQPTVIANILKSVFGNDGVEADEIGLPTDEGLVLPCGASGVKVWKN